MSIPYSSIRGFNYMPGYSAHLQYTWTNFDRESWEREVPYALRFGSNMLRIWLDWGAFLALDEKLFDHMDEAFSVCAANGLKVMPVLFNRWSDPRYPAGGISTEHLLIPEPDWSAYRPYVDGLLNRFGDDERIELWDLCNEPQAPGDLGNTAEAEHAWLSAVAGWMREGSSIPITIGTAVRDNVRHYAALADVISFHPYTRFIGGMTELCESHLALAADFGKPLICTEACVGSLDDIERGELARDGIETLEKFNIGWLAWHLCSGRFVTASPQRTDSNAVRPGEGYMAFVLPDGSTRPGHESLHRQTV